MDLWGKIEFNKKRQKYYVRGSKQPWGQMELYYLPIGNQLACETPELAEALRAEINRDMEDGTFHPRRYKKHKSLTVENVLDQFYESKVQERDDGDINSNSLYKTLQIIKKIKDTIGKLQIHQVNTGTYEKLWKQMRNKYTGKLLQKSTRKRYINLFMEAIDFASGEGYILHAPTRMKFENRFSVPYTEPEALTEEEQYKVISEMPPEYEMHLPFIQTGMLTGPRPSELRALKWTDIDRKAGLIYFNNTFTLSNNFHGEVLGPPKNKKVRVLKYTKVLRDVIEPLRFNKNEFIFINPDTGKVYDRNWCTKWSRIVKEILGKKIKFNNATRHSYAQNLKADGVTSAEIGVALGHVNDNGETARRNYLKRGLNPEAQEKLECKIMNLQERLAQKKAVG